MRKSLLATAALTCLLLVGAACLFHDTEEEFMAFCTDRYGWDHSNSDCQCYWDEMNDDEIKPRDIVGLIRNDDGVDLRARLSSQRANDRCFN